MKWRPWHHVYGETSKQAIDDLERHKMHGGHGVGEHAVSSLVTAILAVAAVGAGAVLELRRIRKLLEKDRAARVATFNLTGSLVPKEGAGGTMANGTYTPDETQDVLFAIDPKNAAGQPVQGPFTWSRSSGGELVDDPATGKKRFVTDAGAIDAIVTVSQDSTGYSESARVVRAAADNNVVSFGLVGEVVPKQ